ncbi:MAG: cytochrome c3 family protein, partial [Myxococcales bacterium]|nr:cytochrome c3 family protein [Myxococcales bacterium]
AAASAAASASASASADGAPSPDAEDAKDDDKDDEEETLPGTGPGHGVHPLFGGEMVPLKWMPPGTKASPLPSDEVFPPQTITIRFNHKLHMKQFEQTCKSCHEGAYGSVKASDRLMPEAEETCDNCHDVDHSDLEAVEAGEEKNGQCGFCHIGADAGKDGAVAKMVIPDPNLRMNHKAHVDRNIDCAQCHGMVGELEAATREQLPRMAGCFSCHAQSGAAQGEAKGACNVCHTTEPSGVLTTEFSTGLLQPPQWLHAAAHTPDWIARHKGVAGGNSDLCSNCHRSEFCTDCHDGRVRPRNIHPGDFLSMHAQAARQDNPRCVSCHQLTSFCADCHRRVGVARDAPSGSRLSGRRFHPPASVWTNGPRSAMHHGWEAQRNINACVGCHAERDCATCHADKGVRGGAGINPHPPGFASGCRAPFRRNPRPCLVCHQSEASVLAPCQ